MVIKGAAAD